MAKIPVTIEIDKKIADVVGYPKTLIGSDSGTVALSGALSKMTFNVSIYDPGGHYTAGTYLSSKTGLYLITGFLLTDSIAWSQGHNLGVRAYINGSGDLWLGRASFGDAETKRAEVPIEGTVFLTAGQALEIWGNASVAVNLINDALWNRIFIEYIGA